MRLIAALCVASLLIAACFACYSPISELCVFPAGYTVADANVAKCEAFNNGSMLEAAASHANQALSLRLAKRALVNNTLQSECEKILPFESQDCIEELVSLACEMSCPECSFSYYFQLICKSQCDAIRQQCTLMDQAGCFSEPVFNIICSSSDSSCTPRLTVDLSYLTKPDDTSGTSDDPLPFDDGSSTGDVPYVPSCNDVYDCSSCLGLYNYGCRFCSSMPEYPHRTRCFNQSTSSAADACASASYLTYCPSDIRRMSPGAIVAIVLGVLFGVFCCLVPCALLIGCCTTVAPPLAAIAVTLGVSKAVSAAEGDNSVPGVVYGRLNGDDDTSIGQ